MFRVGELQKMHFVIGQVYICTKSHDLSYTNCEILVLLGLGLGICIRGNTEYYGYKSYLTLESIHSSQEMANVTVAPVNVIPGTRALHVSVWFLMRPVVPLTTQCVTDEDPASVTAVSVKRDTSPPTVKNAWAAQTPA